jgi:hypothetical protein
VFEIALSAKPARNLKWIKPRMNQIKVPVSSVHIVHAFPWWVSMLINKPHAFWAPHQAVPASFGIAWQPTLSMNSWWFLYCEISTSKCHIISTLSNYEYLIFVSFKNSMRRAKWQSSFANGHPFGIPNPRVFGNLRKVSGALVQNSSDKSSESFCCEEIPGLVN